MSKPLEERVDIVECELKALSSMLAEVLDPHRIVELKFQVVIGACAHCGSPATCPPHRAYDPFEDEWLGWNMYCLDCSQWGQCLREPPTHSGETYNLYAIARLTRVSGETEEGYADPDGRFYNPRLDNVVAPAGELGWRVIVVHGFDPKDLSFDGTFDGTAPPRRS